jgi:hypothetical protein
MPDAIVSIELVAADLEFDKGDDCLLVKLLTDFVHDVIEGDVALFRMLQIGWLHGD